MNMIINCVSNICRYINFSKLFFINLEQIRQSYFIKNKKVKVRLKSKKISQQQRTIIRTHQILKKERINVIICYAITINLDIDRKIKSNDFLEQEKSKPKWSTISE